MAIASDADETSTGSSGNPVENDDSNMLADTTSNQIDCTVHHYYEKLKDFAFDMPAGWTDPTISLFIDTFKFYKEDFSRPQPDELKIWQKIVKRCVERSNNHKVFTVNSIMELAGSLKSHVLRNEYRKDDENFKLLLNDVADIMPYFPNTTCDSVSQNLKLRQKNMMQTQPSETKASEPSTSQTDNNNHPPSNINIILKYCEALNLNKAKYFSNSSWSNMSKKIEENENVKIDLKKYLQNMKKKLLSDWKAESDPEKRKQLFEEVVGPLEPYFDLMPPRTIKVEDFAENIVRPPTENGDSSDDVMETIKELQKSEPPQESGPRVYKRATPKKIPGNFTLEDFPKISQILGVSDSRQSSDSDEPAKLVRIPIHNPSSFTAASGCTSQSHRGTRNHLSEDLTSDSVTSPETPQDMSVEGEKEPAKKIITPKKRNSTETKTKIKKPRLNTCDEETVVGRNRSSRSGKRLPVDSTKPTRHAAKKNMEFKGNTDSSDEDSSQHRNIRSRSYKQTLPEINKTTKTTSSRKNAVLGSQEVKSQSSSGDRNIVFKTQAKVELSPLAMARNNEDAVAGPSGHRTREKPGNNYEPMEVSPSNGESYHEPRALHINSEKVKTRNIVAPINVKVNDQASSSSSKDPSYSRTESMIKPRSRSPLSLANVHKDISMLDRMEDITVGMVEGYTEKVKSTRNNVLKLLPKQHVAVNPVGVMSSASGSSSELGLQQLSVTKPPNWFDSFMVDYKKHEMWKMHQILKMQQELVDMENKKLLVLDKILSSLNHKK